MLNHNSPTSDSRSCREFRAETVSEAIRLACAEMEVHPEDLIYEVKDSGLLNILGFDSELATISVFQEIDNRLSNRATKKADQEPVFPNGQSLDAAHSRLFEAAARKYGLSYRDVVSGFADGALEFTPEGQRLRLVETDQAESVAEKSITRSTRSSDRVPAGYWSKTDELISRFRSGEERLLWDIVLRLEPVITVTVDKMLETISPHALDRDDLLQIARIEIISLIRSYQPESDTKIYVYMRQWLYYRIMREVQTSSLVRVPINNPNPELKLRADHFAKSCSYVSLDFLPEDFGLSDETGFAEIMNADLYERVRQRVMLSERHWYVLCHRYGLDGVRVMTLEQVGATLNLTRERVRQIQIEAVEQIKYRFTIAHGDFFLDADPEPERSISATHEWLVDMFPYRKPAQCVVRWHG